MALTHVKFLGQRVVSTDSGGDSQLLIAVGDVTFPSPAESILYSSFDGENWTSVPRLSPGPVIAEVNGIFFKTFQVADEVGIISGDAKGYVWDGVGLTESTIPADAVQGDSVLDRNFIWTRVDDDNEVIRYTNPGVMMTYPTVNTIGMPAKQPGDVIRSIVGYKDRLVIFKTDSIHVLFLTGTPINWQLKEFVRGIGCTGVYASCIAEDWIYFVDRKGVYRTNLSTIEDISGSIKSAFDNRKSVRQPGSMLSTDPLERVLGLQDSICYYRNMILCSVKIDASTDLNNQNYRMFVFHLDSESWTEWDINVLDSDDDWNYPINMLPVEEVGAGLGQPSAIYPPTGIYIGALEGRAYRYPPFDEPGYTDADGKYDCRFVTKSYDLDSGMELKKMPYCTIRTTVENDVIDLHVAHSRERVTTASETITNGMFKNVKFAGPGYVREYALDATFEVQDGETDTTGIEVIEVGLGVREPKPFQTFQKTPNA